MPVADGQFPPYTGDSLAEAGIRPVFPASMSVSPASQEPFPRDAYTDHATGEFPASGPAFWIVKVPPTACPAVDPAGTGTAVMA